MPEVNKNAAILIAVSWQALNRSLEQVEDRILCDNTVAILFAGFFVEANLNDIIGKLHRTPDLMAFLFPRPKTAQLPHKRHQRRFPGLQDKLAWFYNEYIAKQKATRKRDLYGRLRRRFPGFDELYRFRNDISHGKINQSAGSIQTSQRLRQQAKDIVDDLFRIVEKKTGRRIRRVTNYYDAIRLR